MEEHNNAEYEELFREWVQSDWTEKDPIKLVRIARQLTELRPSYASAWDALATSIFGTLFPPERELSEEEKADLKGNPLFWEMVNAFEKVMTIDSDEASAPWNRAIGFEKAGIFDRAYQDYLRVAEIEKRKPPSDEPYAVYIDLFLAGKAALGYGDTNAAIEALKASVKEGGSNDREVWYGLAEALEKAGRNKEAKEARQSAISLSP